MSRRAVVHSSSLSMRRGVAAWTSRLSRPAVVIVTALALAASLLSVIGTSAPRAHAADAAPTLADVSSIDLAAQGWRSGLAQMALWDTGHAIVPKKLVANRTYFLRSYFTDGSKPGGLTVVSNPGAAPPKTGPSCGKLPEDKYCGVTAVGQPLYLWTDPSGTSWLSTTAAISAGTRHRVTASAYAVDSATKAWRLLVETDDVNRYSFPAFDARHNDLGAFTRGAAESVSAQFPPQGWTDAPTVQRLNDVVVVSNTVPQVVSSTRIAATGVCAEPCFQLTGAPLNSLQANKVLGTLSVNAAGSVFTPASRAAGSEFVTGAWVGYNTASAPTLVSATNAPPDSWPARVVVKTPSATLALAPNSAADPAGRAVWRILYAVARVSRPNADLVAEAARPSDAQVQRVGSLELQALQGTPGFDASRVVVKDSYTQAELPKQVVPADLADPATVLEPAIGKYLFTGVTGLPQCPLAAFDSASRARVGRGFMSTDGGATYRPVLALRTTTSSCVSDLTGAQPTSVEAVAALRVVLTGVVAQRSALVRAGDPASGHSSYVAAAPAAVGAAVTLTGTWTPADLPKVAAVGDTLGYGYYQQLDAAGKDVGARVRVLLAPAPNGGVSPSDPVSTPGAAAAVRKGLAPLLAAGDLAGRAQNYAAEDTLTTYLTASVQGTVTTGDRSGLALAMRAQAVTRTGNEFGTTNGGRTKLTPIEAADLFADPATLSAATQTGVRSATFHQDLKNFAAERAGILAQTQQPTPGGFAATGMSTQQGTLTPLSGVTPGSAPAAQDLEMMRFVLVWIHDELAVSRPDATNDRLATSYDVLLARLQRQYPQSTLDQRATAVLNAYRTMGIDNKHYQDVAPHGTTDASRLIEAIRRALSNITAEDADQTLDVCAGAPGWGNQLSYAGLLFPGGRGNCNGGHKETFYVRDDAMAGRRELAKLQIAVSDVAKNRTAQQLVRAGHADFPVWAGSDPAYAALVTDLRDATGHLAALVSTLDTDLGTSLGAALSADATLTKFNGVTWGDLTVDQKRTIAGDAVLAYLSIAQAGLTLGGMSVSVFTQRIQQLNEILKAKGTLTANILDAIGKIPQSRAVSDVDLASSIRGTIADTNKAKWGLAADASLNAVASIIAVVAIALYATKKHHTTADNIAFIVSLTALAKTALRFIWTAIDTQLDAAARRALPAVARRPVNNAEALADVLREVDHRRTEQFQTQYLEQLDALKERSPTQEEGEALAALDRYDTDSSATTEALSASEDALEDAKLAAEQLLDIRRTFARDLLDAALKKFRRDYEQGAGQFDLYLDKWFDDDTTEAMSEVSVDSKVYADLSSAEEMRAFCDAFGITLEDSFAGPGMIDPDKFVTMIDSRVTARGRLVAYLTKYGKMTDGVAQAYAGAMIAEARTAGNHAPYPIKRLVFWAKARVLSGSKFQVPGEYLYRYLDIDEAALNLYTRGKPYPNETLEEYLTRERGPESPEPAGYLDAQIADNVGRDLAPAAQDAALTTGTARRMLGLVIHGVLVAADVAGAVVQVVMAARDIDRAVSATQRTVARVDLASGVLFLVGAVIGALLSTGVGGMLAAFGLVVFIVARILSAVIKDPTKDRDYLAAWLQPFVDAKLTRGAFAVNQLQYWHEHNVALWQKFPVCTSATSCASPGDRAPSSTIKQKTFPYCLTDGAVAFATGTTASLVACDGIQPHTVVSELGGDTVRVVDWHTHRCLNGTAAAAWWAPCSSWESSPGAPTSQSWRVTTSGTDNSILTISPALSATACLDGSQSFSGGRVSVAPCNRTTVQQWASVAI